MASEDSTDGGLIEFKSEEELKEQLDELGLQFRYGCFMDKRDVSCHSFGQWLENYRRNDKKALEVFEHTCEKYGFGESCLKVANRRLTSDPASALTYFRKACDVGHSRGCFGAGLHLLRPEQRDAAAAVEAFQRACELGFGAGCFRAAAIVLQGQGHVAKDPARAARLFERGCRGGDFPSCVNLSVMYARGDGVAADAAKAKEFRDLAEELKPSKPK